MTNAEINDRATTIANLAALASTLPAAAGAEKLLIMEVASHLAHALTRPAYLLDKQTGNVIPFTGGKA